MILSYMRASELVEKYKDDVIGFINYCENHIQDSFQSAIIISEIKKLDIDLYNKIKSELMTGKYTIKWMVALSEGK